MRLIFLVQVKKTTNIHEQNPVLNGYHIESELEDVLKDEYFNFLLGYINVDWFLDKCINLESKMAFSSKNIKKVSL